MESARSPSVSSFSSGSLAVPGGWVQGWGPPPSEGPEAGAGVGVGSGRERKERKDSMPESYWLSSVSSGPLRASDMPAVPARGGQVRAGSGSGLRRAAFPGCRSALRSWRPARVAFFPGCGGPRGRREARARLGALAGSKAVATPGSWTAQWDALSRPAPQAPPPADASGPRPRPPESPLPRPLRWLRVRGYPVLSHSCVNSQIHSFVGSFGSFVCPFIHSSVCPSVHPFIFSPSFFFSFIPCIFFPSSLSSTSSFIFSIHSFVCFFIFLIFRKKF